MTEHAYYNQAIHGPYETHSIGDHVLEEGGTFVTKVLAGGAENEMQTLLKRNFRKVANVKPAASRADSSEKFVVAMGFRGRQVEGGEGQGGQDDPEAGPLG